MITQWDIYPIGYVSPKAKEHVMEIFLQGTALIGIAFFSLVLQVKIIRPIGNCFGYYF